MRGVLRKIIQQVDLKQLSAVPGPKMENKVEENKDNSETITQAWIWPRVGQFLKENDIVITETGTANFGIWETKFPKGVTAISQVLWRHLLRAMLNQMPELSFSWVMALSSLPLKRSVQ
jgi:pyruvate decarboxylase